jgi:hypothetical protein
MTYRMPLPPIIERNDLPEGTILVLPANILAVLSRGVPWMEDEPYSTWLHRAFREHPDAAKRCAIIRGVGL